MPTRETMAVAFTLAEYVGGPHDGTTEVLEGLPMERRIMAPPPGLSCIEERPYAPPERPLVGTYRRRGTAHITIDRHLVACLPPEEFDEFVARKAPRCDFTWEGWS